MNHKGLFPKSVHPGLPRLGTKPDGWITLRLGEVLEVKTRPAEIRDQDEYQLVTAKRSREGIVSRGIKKGASIKVKSQFYTMRMWQGVSALSCLEGIVSPAYTICVPKHDIDGSFAAHLFKFPPVVNLFYRYSQGLVGDTLNLKFPHFAQITVDLPPLSEQKKIAAVLGSSDREIESLVALSDRIKEQKRGLMQKLLTGQIRVKAAEESTA
jgi:restriction endonuclease S subunit